VFLRVLSLLDPEQFQRAFANWMVEVFRIMGMQGQLAVDGQTLRRSHDRSKGQNAVHMLHGLWCETGLVVAQRPTDTKSNEITAIPELLKLLSLEATLVSIDAMGTQVAIAKQIRKQGGDYLLALKGNQGTLSKQVLHVFQEARDARKRNVDEAQPPVIQRATEVDKGHGRVETRTAEIITDFGDWVPESKRWVDLRTLVAIVARREDLTTGEVSEQTRYYISSADLSPTRANEATRKHWLVENGLHYRLDVTFNQDSCRTRTLHAAENLAVVRHFVVNILRNFRGDKYSMPRRRRLCDYDPAYRSRVLKAAMAP
jgi:predicted transposase YbfD/YdcC